MATLLRKYDSPVRCVVALISVSNSEFSHNRGTVSFYLLQRTVSGYDVFRAVKRVSQEKMTNTAGKARNFTGVQLY